MKRSYMKNLFLGIIFSLFFLSFACKENEEIEILTVASKRPKSLGYEIIPTYWIKSQEENQWTRIVESIKGFDYEEGYEYVVEVRKWYKTGELMEDEVGSYYILLRIVSKEKKESIGIPDLQIQ